MCLPRVVLPPAHSMPATRRCNLYKKVWQGKLKLSAWHLKGMQATPIDWTSPPECNLPFDSATRYPVGSKERLACSVPLKYYLRIGSVEELPLQISDGL